MLHHPEEGGAFGFYIAKSMGITPEVIERWIASQDYTRIYVACAGKPYSSVAVITTSLARSMDVIQSKFIFGCVILCALFGDSTF